MNRRRGHTFTIEALLGALLFILFLMSIAAYANAFKENSWTIPEERMADDVLIVLEKNGTFATMNSTLIENEIGLILGNSSRFRLEMNTYNYTRGAYADISETAIGAALSNSSEISVAERGFFSTFNGSVSNYTVARLYTWK